MKPSKLTTEDNLPAPALQTAYKKPVSKIPLATKTSQNKRVLPKATSKLSEKKVVSNQEKNDQQKKHDETLDINKAQELLTDQVIITSGQ